MRTDVLIIGCGIAGASAALRMAEDGERHITLIARGEDPSFSSSGWAQGGIVAYGHDDSAELLIEDVINSGAGLSHPPAVEVLAEEGPRLLQERLIDRAGVQFDRDDAGGFAFGLEAAHSRRRILHAGDSTGATVMRGLLQRLDGLPNVELLTRHTAVDLLTFPHHSRDPLAIYGAPACHGAYVFDQARRVVRRIVARGTILASGGLGQIFLNTTNPAGSRGDGLAMAYRAGVRVINAEYVQFHPTALHTPGVTKPLISEAVRGEGAVLLTIDGKRFMERHAPDRLELATRDVVARAIYTEMLSNGYPYVLLDIASQRPAQFIERRFPSIRAACLEHGIDITSCGIPVVPAAHYFCGGVQVDLWGQTSMSGLYAVGEVACTGAHGANRLASTSLLEGLTWGDRAARHIQRHAGGKVINEDEAPPWSESDAIYEPDPALIQGDMQTIRNLMWHYVGLIRHRYRLDRANRELRRLWINIEDFYRKVRLSDDLIGLRNSVLNALILTQAALASPTSRGCHYRDDSRPSPGAVPPDENNRS